MKECNFGTGKISEGFFAYVRGTGNYLFKDGKLREWQKARIELGNRLNELGYFATEADLKKAISDFCEEKPVRTILKLEGENVPLRIVSAKLVSDGSGERVVLQVQTSETPEFIPVARLEVKNGKVVMYRERGVKSKFINTDSEGRIQN